MEEQTVTVEYTDVGEDEDPWLAYNVHGRWVEAHIDRVIAPSKAKAYADAMAKYDAAVASLAPPQRSLIDRLAAKRYRGVTWNDREKSWQARYDLDGGGWKILGMFATKAAASRKYEAYAAKSKQPASKASPAGGAKKRKRVSSAASAVVQEDDDEENNASVGALPPSKAKAYAVAMAKYTTAVAALAPVGALAIASLRTSASTKRARPSSRPKVVAPLPSRRCKYAGVLFATSGDHRGKYVARVSRSKKGVVWEKVFESEVNAARARDAFCREDPVTVRGVYTDMRLAFPTDADKARIGTCVSGAAVSIPASASASSSSAPGVVQRKKRRKGGGSVRFKHSN